MSRVQRRGGRRHRSRQRDSSSGRSQSPVHSAHAGQEVEVHYRWHPLYGRRVRRHYSEQRAAGQVVHVEAMPGVVTAIAAWMLDPVACAGMATIGTPRVTVSALIELHHLLSERGFKRSCRDDQTAVADSVYARAEANLSLPIRELMWGMPGSMLTCVHMSEMT